MSSLVSLPKKMLEILENRQQVRGCSADFKQIVQLGSLPCSYIESSTPSSSLSAPTCSFPAPSGYCDVTPTSSRGKSTTASSALPAAPNR